MGFLSDSEQKRIIATNLDNLITLSGKNQYQISVDLDVNPPTFNQWVKGKAIPSVSMLKRLAAYFNVTMSQIVNDQTLKPEHQDPELSDQDRILLEAYHHADKSIQTAVAKLLDIHL